MATFAFGLAFGAMAIHIPEHARKIKGDYIGYLKTSGLSPKMLDILERAMLEACDLVEKLRR